MRSAVTTLSTRQLEVRNRSGYSRSAIRKRQRSTSATLLCYTHPSDWLVCCFIVENLPCTKTESKEWDVQTWEMLGVSLTDLACLH